MEATPPAEPVRVSPRAGVPPDQIEIAPGERRAGHPALLGHALRRTLRPVVRRTLRLLPLGRQVYWSLPRTCEAVLLTFDDGPDPDWTPRVLDILRDHHASASFFLLGGKASACPELVERIRAEGHSVGSHSFSHTNLRRVSPLRAWRDLREADAVFARLTGGPVRWLRPPYGAFSMASLWYARRKRAATVLWNRDPLDYEPGDARAILERLGPLHAGDVVLLHDRSAALVEALPEILARIGDAGLQPLSLDRALGAGL